MFLLKRVWSHFILACTLRSLVVCTSKLFSSFFIRNPGEGEGFGILEDDFFTIRHDWKLQQLQEIIPILSNWFHFVLFIWWRIKIETWISYCLYLKLLREIRLHFKLDRHFKGINQSWLKMTHSFLSISSIHCQGLFLVCWTRPGIADFEILKPARDYLVW